MTPNRKKAEEEIDLILERIKTGTPLTVTNKARLKIWFGELIEPLYRRIEELEKEKELFTQSLGTMGTNRECGHFVNDIMSFCPVCREVSDLKLLAQEYSDNAKKIQKEYLELEEKNRELNTKLHFLNCENCEALYCCNGLECGCRAMPVDYKPTEKCESYCTLNVIQKLEARLEKAVESMKKCANPEEHWGVLKEIEGEV